MTLIGKLCKTLKCEVERPRLFALLLLSATTFAFPNALPCQVARDTTGKHAGLAGTVRDSLGGPIRRVSVFVEGGLAATITDDSGRFDLRGLPSGESDFTLSKIGYAPVSFRVALPHDSLVVVAIRMRSVQALPVVSVVGERESALLKRTGFFERRKLALGSFLSPEQIDSVADRITVPSQFLRGARGIDFRCGSSCVPVPRNFTGCLWLFVDGIQHGQVATIDSLGLTPSSIAAIEGYDRSGIVPT